MGRSPLPKPRRIGPQPGPQEDFLTTPADIAIFGGAAGGGKALKLDTPIPTPTGFTPIGDLCAGDTVFGADGAQVRVTHAYDPLLCDGYLVRFDDGSELIASEDHLWSTLTAADLTALSRRTPEYRAARRARRASRATGRRSQRFTESLIQRNQENPPPCLDPPAGSVKTTRDIAATLRLASGRTNHAIPLAGPIQTEDACLPLDPYVFGAWLGDGSKGSGQIHGIDDQVFQEIAQAGWTIRPVPSQSCAHRIEGLTATLKSMGVLGAKCVPQEYMRASASQRLSLLQGLMDSDGHCNINGKVEFCNTNRLLADAVFDLATSLGQKPSMCLGRATLYGKDCGEKYRVQWVPNIPAFRLNRKVARQNNKPRRTTRMRYIVSCEPIGQMWMRCIAVDAPDKLFLAGTAMIPTHNSFAILLEPIRHANNPDFGAVIFRRSMPQIMNEGGLWDDSASIYEAMAEPVTSPYPQWRFPSGAKVSFRHLELDKTVYDWQGSQLPLIVFDELCHFSEAQFWYMLSRNRSTCGVNPYVRATCNPDPDSFVAELIKWWIDQDTGYAIPERSGVIRYMLRVGGDIVWSDTSEELERRYPEACFQEVDGEPVKIGPKSLTFIHSRVEDNKELLRVNPEYLANLNALPHVERERLKNGNWKVRDERTVIYKPSWWRIWPKDKPLPRILHAFASWDTAFTAADQRITKDGKPPDQSSIAYSACLVFGVWLDEQDCSDAHPEGRHKILLMSAWWGRVDWDDLLERVKKIGSTKLTRPSDAHIIEAAASGRSVIQVLRRNPSNRVIGVTPTAGDSMTDAKVLRAYQSQPYLKSGMVWAPDREWVQTVIQWLAGFPGGRPPSADLADCMSMAVQHLSQGYWIHHPDDELQPIDQVKRQADEFDMCDDEDVPAARGGFYS